MNGIFPWNICGRSGTIEVAGRIDDARRAPHISAYLATVRVLRQCASSVQPSNSSNVMGKNGCTLALAVSGEFAYLSAHREGLGLSVLIAHTTTMAEAFLVSVIPKIQLGREPLQSLWAVIADDQEEAIALVQERVIPGGTADKIMGKLSPEIVIELGLQPGQPKHL